MKLVSNIDSKIKELVKLYEKKKDLENELEKVSDEVNNILRVELPDVMISNGVQVGSITKFKDYTIELKTYKDTKVKDQEKFYNWLEKEGYGDIIKEVLSANLRYSENKEKAKKELEKLGIVYDVKKSIHPQTLKAFANEVDLKSNEEAGVVVMDGVITTIKSKRENAKKL